MDYAARHAALRALKTLYADEGAAACGQHLLESLPEGRIKLYLTWKTLTVRRECEQVFRDGDYLPLKRMGACGRVCAFTRHRGNETLLVVVPRLGGLMGEHGRPPVGETVWGDTSLELPPERMDGKWTNTLTGETFSMQEAPGKVHRLALAQLFKALPYALLRAQKREADHTASIG